MGTVDIKEVGVNLVREFCGIEPKRAIKQHTKASGHDIHTKLYVEILENKITKFEETYILLSSFTSHLTGIPCSMGFYQYGFVQSLVDYQKFSTTMLL